MVYHRGNGEGRQSGSCDSCIGKKSWKVMVWDTTVRMSFSMAERQIHGVVDPSGNPSTSWVSQDQLRFWEEKSGIKMHSWSISKISPKGKEDQIPQWTTLTAGMGSPSNWNIRLPAHCSCRATSITEFAKSSFSFRSAMDKMYTETHDKENSEAICPGFLPWH